MTLIKISDLTTADSNLSAGTDSFLNELQKAQTTQIFGGWGGGGWKKDKHNSCDDGGWKKDKHNSCDDGGWKEDKHNSCDDGGWKEDKHNSCDDGGWKGC